MTRWAARLALALLAASCCLAQPARPPQKGEDAFLSGPPFSLNDILQRVGIIADKRLSAAIERRGIAFSPTPEDFDRLKEAGAGTELLQIVTLKAPPKPTPTPTPTPTPVPRAGPLVVRCQPAECDVALNGKPHGTTSRGIVEVRDLLVGDAVIDLRKDGFEGQQLSIPMRAGVPATREVTLQPTPATRARVGKTLVARMIEKLGGKDAFQRSAILAAAGSASLFQKDGQRTDWQVSSRLKLPSMALLELSGAKVKWWTSLSGDDSKAGGAKQLTGGPVAIEMERLVRLYRDYQPSMLVARLNGMTVQAMDVTPQPSGEWRVRLFNREAGFRITLDAEAALIRVIYESSSGLGSGLEVAYSDYISIQQAWYPKSMTIKFADQQQHGLELHFSEVEFVDKLVNKDFHR